MKRKPDAKCLSRIDLYNRVRDARLEHNYLAAHFKQKPQCTADLPANPPGELDKPTDIAPVFYQDTFIFGFDRIKALQMLRNQVTSSHQNESG